MGSNIFGKLFASKNIANISSALNTTKPTEEMPEIDAEIREKAEQIAKRREAAKEERKKNRKLDPYKTPAELYSFLKGKEVFGENEVVFEFDEQKGSLTIVDKTNNAHVFISKRSFRGSLTQGVMVQDKNGNRFPATRVSIFVKKKVGKLTNPDEIPHVNVILVN